LSNEEKTNDYEKGMIYMKILKKGGLVEKRGLYLSDLANFVRYFLDGIPSSAEVR
jgi:hypothetical protein